MLVQWLVEAINDKAQLTAAESFEADLDVRVMFLYITFRYYAMIVFAITIEASL